MPSTRKLHTGPGSVELPGGQRMLVRDGFQTARNPVTGRLEAYPGESQVAPHPFAGEGRDCSECHYPADALCHEQKAEASDQGE